MAPIRGCVNCQHVKSSRSGGLLCGLATPPRPTHRYSLCASWEIRAPAPEPAEQAAAPPPGSIAERAGGPPAPAAHDPSEPRPGDLERVIAAIRQNPYLRSLGALVRAARIGGRRARASLETLTAAGRVHRVGDVFRLTECETEAVMARLAKATTHREKHETRLREHREKAQRAKAREHELEALNEGLKRALEHRANVRRKRLDRDVSAYSTLRSLHRLAYELGLPLSNLIAAAEVRAGLREQTDVFQTFWSGHGQQGRGACPEEK